MFFTPAAFPSIVVPPGVGRITTDLRDIAATLSAAERDALSASFKAAYINGIFREAPLAGVLGGDSVHGWPLGGPSAWVQNWRTLAPANNSWGIPELLLAIRGFREERETSAGRVFLVHGQMLDKYGRSAGVNGANGSAGYGSPRGYEFLHNGKKAQRFDLGLITIDREGRGAFFPESPPSLGLEPPAALGVFADAAGHVRPAFITAWKMALDRGIEAMIPDGPGQYFAFLDSAWDFPGADTLSGIYIQTFNERTILLVLPDSPVLPPYPRFMASPFLEVLLSASWHTLPGGELLSPLDINFSADEAFYRAFMRGLAMYGIPLTDPMPIGGDENDPASWREGMRFSRGWLVNPEYGNH